MIGLIGYGRFGKVIHQLFESGFDISNRREDIRGLWPDKRDSVPVDELGGWRENWSVYYVGRKP